MWRPGVEGLMGDQLMEAVEISDAMPTVGRVCEDVLEPPNRPLDSDKLWSGPDGKPNLEVMKDWFFREGFLSGPDAAKLCAMGADVLRAEKNVVTIDGAVTVCGDIHGQFYDLIKLFEVGGDPLSTIYLFLGDYVDRGQFGFECAMYLLAHKILFPDNFFLLRGNHECRHLTAYFNFKEECLYKYDEATYEAIMDTFDTLPLAAVVNKKFMCMHGGLSPDFETVEDINKIDRFDEPPPSGPMCDLLWSDPYEDMGDDPDAESITFAPNTTRGCSWYFGPQAVKDFLEANNLLSILRAHEAQIDGYKMHGKRGKTDFPAVITLFSAPNYCDTYANKGAILKYHDNLMNIRQFNCSPHPYHLPSFMNVFEWSLPFVGDKISEFCLSIVNSVSDEDDALEAAAPAMQDKGPDKATVNVIKNKIRSAAKFAVMLKALRDHSEDILKIKNEMPDNRIPPGLLQKGTVEIKRVIDSFDKAKGVDRLNERRPSNEDVTKRVLTRRRSSLTLNRGESQPSLIPE